MSRTEQLETEQIQYQCNSRNDHLNHLHCKGESNTPYLYFQDNNFQNTGVNMITQFLDKILQFLHCVDMSISFVKTPHVPTQQAWHFINPRTKYLCNWWRKPCVIYGFNKCYDAFPIMSARKLVPAHICWTCEQAQSGEVTKHLLMFLLLGGQAKYFAAEKCNLWKDTCLVCKCFVKCTKIDKHDMIWHDMSPTLEYQSFKLRDRKAVWKVRSCTPELLFVVLPVVVPLICTLSIVTWG